MPGELFDASSEPGSSVDHKKDGDGRSQRPFVGVQFDCCGVYSRVYLSRDGSAYVGHCPRCGKQVRLKVGPGGTDARFFTAK